MKETINALEHLQQRTATALELLQPDKIRHQIVDFDKQMQDPSFWDDQKKARIISQRSANLSQRLEDWEGLKKEIDELLDLALEDKDDLDVNLRKEIDEQIDVLQKRYDKLELALLMKGEHDYAGAIISIHAGAGGDDAQDWAEMLARMYSRWAEKKNFSYDILNIARGSNTGIKSITLRIGGEFVYGQLVSEYGVHRLVRISPFDADHARHTSFALVEVLPELDEVGDIELDMKDLRIDTFASSGAGGQSVNTTNSAVRIVHIPTNISVSCQNERSQQQNKETALNILKIKLQQLANQQRVNHIKDLKGEHKEVAWGNQIRSYVLHPYKLVKDLRTDYEESNPDKVLDGEIDEFIEAYLRMNVAV